MPMLPVTLRATMRRMSHGGLHTSGRRKPWRNGTRYRYCTSAIDRSIEDSGRLPHRNFMSNREMEEEQRLELIILAIRRLLEENKKKESSDWSFVEGDEKEDRTLLRNLLSQIESLKEGTEASAVDTLETKAKNSVKEDIVDDEYSREDIVKELKKVKKQNLLTHCLLSAMIVLTVVWQLSEVSIILSVKDKISHPFRSLGSFLSGVLKRPKSIVDNTGKNSSKQDHDEGSVLPPLKIPELPHVDLP